MREQPEETTHMLRITRRGSPASAELSRLLPEDQQVPPKLSALLAIQFVINGDGTSIIYSPQSAVGGSTNVTIGGAGVESVTVVGAHGSATGGQAMQADRVAVTVGRDAPTVRGADPPSTEGWWARLRKRGIVVALATRPARGMGAPDDSQAVPLSASGPGLGSDRDHR
jgi:hypothetical protein